MHPPASRAERLTDAALHAAGIIAALVGATVLLSLALSTGEPRRIGATSVYCLGLVTLVTVSGLYHTTADPRWKAALRPFDHAAIYGMIAGTYTPLTLLSIGGWVGHALLALIWGTAVVGITLKLLWPDRLERTSLVLYLTMGWLGAVAIVPLVEALPAPALVLLAAGGILYTAGVPFHLSRMKFQNAIWHAFVLAGAACHFGTIAYSVTA